MHIKVVSNWKYNIISLSTLTEVNNDTENWNMVIVNYRNAEINDDRPIMTTGVNCLLNKRTQITLIKQNCENYITKYLMVIQCM